MKAKLSKLSYTLSIAFCQILGPGMEVSVQSQEP